MISLLLFSLLFSLSQSICRDNHRYCSIWAGAGMCNPKVDNGYVIPNCKKSCNTCVEEVEKYLKMIKPLSSVSLGEGSSLLLEARAQGYPVPTVTMELSSGGVRKKLNTTVITGDNNLVVVSYVVPQVTIEDDGVYTALFTNAAGEDVTRGIVNVTRLITEPTLEIIRGLETTIAVNEGEILLLEVELEVTMDVEPDHAELYHYVDEHWDIVKNFNFYSPLPGKFIGRYQQSQATLRDSGEYMFTVGTRKLVRKSFGKVNVLTKAATLDFLSKDRNITFELGTTAEWEVKINFYPSPPKILVYKVKDLQWTKIDAVTIGTIGEQMTVSYYSYPAQELDADDYDGYNSNDIRLDDEPGAFIEPRFAKVLSNITAEKGAAVQLNVIAHGSDKFQMTLLKVQEGSELLLAGAAPSVNSNWLNLTYVIDSLDEFTEGVYKAVLISGPFVKTVIANVKIGAKGSLMEHRGLLQNDEGSMARPMRTIQRTCQPPTVGNAVVSPSFIMVGGSYKVQCKSGGIRWVKCLSTGLARHQIKCPKV